MRVITYNDPRTIDKIQEWNSFKNIPHLCVSQTLVQGLSHKCGRSNFNILTTIDRFINEFYSGWKNNAQLNVAQYIDITNEIEKIEDKKYKKVFYENRSSIAKAVRILIEADTGLNDFSDSIKTEEFTLFKSIYSELLGSSNWNGIEYAKDKGIEEVKISFYNIMINEIKEEMKKIKFVLEKSNVYLNDIEELCSKEELFNIFKRIEPNLIDINKKKGIFAKKDDRNKLVLERLNSYFKYLNDLDELVIDKIIIHGVHQFTPLMTRLIKQLESMKIEVIFLINYNEDLLEIYETWNNVYNWTNSEFEINKIDSDEYSSSLANDYANLIKGNIKKVKGEIKNNVIKFDNITEFSNYVAEIYEENNNSDLNKSEKLAKMREQFYSVNGEEVNNLLSVYFPEQFGEKHFLSYPIGQFILGLYNMWDFKKQEVKLSEDILKEVLAVNLWTKGNETTAIEIFNKVRAYFNNIEDIEKYIESIDRLIKYVGALNTPKWSKNKADYELLSFFSCDLNEVKLYKEIILDIKDIAERLFKNRATVNINQHYKELLEILKQRDNINHNISEKEYEFVEEIFERLGNDESNLTTAVKEVKDMLHFYLAQSKDTDSSNWIVRDFEQLDGGVFLADESGVEFRVGEVKSIYHYAEICDNNMSNPQKVKLPWPLNDNYFKKENEILKAYLISKKEYSNFLKYTLFYGMYYLNREIKISYIENTSSDKKESLYFILRLIGLKVEEYSKKSIDYNGVGEIEERKATELVDKNIINKEEGRMMSFCPRRYYYEGLIDKLGTYNSFFQCKRYIQMIYGILVTNKLRKEGTLLDENRRLLVASERVKNGEQLIPAWERHFQDIKAGVIFHCKSQGQKRDEAYEEIKKNYLSMKFTHEDKSIVVQKYNYTHELNIIRENILKFIKGIETEDLKIDPIEAQCRDCKYREICTHVYREGD